MRVLFVTPYFPPELGAPQTRIYESAARLVKMGHEVSVLTTFPSYPSGIVPKEWRKLFFWKGVDQGIRIYRIWSYAVPNRGFLRRLLSQLSFALFASGMGLVLPKCDAIIVESPPLFDGFIGLFVGYLKRIPYLFTVADLWPESAVQLGILKNRTLIWLSEQIEMLFYRGSVRVLVVTSGIRNKVISRGIRSSKVLLFRNAVDLHFFHPNLNAAEVRRSIGGADEFVVLYAGTLGMAHNLDVVLQTAALFQREGNKHVKFVLAGDGADKERLQMQARDLRLTNLEFLDPYPKVRMPLLLNAADCVVVSLSDLEIFRGALPTKLLEAMACAKPVVLAVGGEAAGILMEAKAGYCASPGDHMEMHDAIIKISHEPEIAAEMGKNGREYACQYFDRDRRVEELVDLLENLISSRRGPRTTADFGTGSEAGTTPRECIEPKVSDLKADASRSAEG